MTKTRTPAKSEAAPSAPANPTPENAQPPVADLPREVVLMEATAAKVGELRAAQKSAIEELEAAEEAAETTSDDTTLGKVHLLAKRVARLSAEREQDEEALRLLIVTAHAILIRLAQRVVRYRIAALCGEHATILEQRAVFNSTNRGGQWRAYFFERLNVIDAANYAVNARMVIDAERLSESIRETLADLEEAKADLGHEPRDADLRLI